MGLWDDIFGSKEKGGGFEEIPLTAGQKRAEKYLEDLYKGKVSFAPRKIAGLTESEQRAVDIVTKVMRKGIPEIGEAKEYVGKMMREPITPGTIPGFEGVYGKYKQLGSEMMGKTMAGLQLTGNLPRESSPGGKVAMRTAQNVMNEFISSILPIYSQMLSAKTSAPERYAGLATSEITTPVGLGTTVGARPRELEQSILDAVMEAKRLTKTFPFTAQAPVAQGVYGAQRYAYQPPTVSPSLFSQIAGPASMVAAGYLMGPGASAASAATPWQQGMAKITNPWLNAPM